MNTPAFQPYVLWWPPGYISTGGVGMGQVNKFKRVSSVRHQISVARGSAGPGGGVPCLIYMGPGGPV